MKLGLEAPLYVDRAVFEREREALFARSWQYVGPESRLSRPGAYLCVDLAGIGVIVMRSRDGRLSGFLNVCRHRGAPLLDPGEGCTARIRCPYHNWVYDDDGALLRAPAFGDPDAIDPTDWSLEPVAVETWRGLVFACVDPAGSLAGQLGDALAEFAGDPLERCRSDRRERLVFDANWKIYTDNFVEGYHIPGIHPAFFRAIDFERFESVARDGLVRMSAPTANELFYEGRWYWMWPNWTLSPFAGGFSTSRINPLSEARTELVYDFWFADDDTNTPEHRERTVASNLTVIREDFRVCQGVHANYAAGRYRPGPLSPRHEAGVAYFQDRYRAALA